MKAVTVDPEGNRVGQIAKHISTRVAVRTSGHLVCNLCSDLWCEHIEATIKNDEDVDSVMSLSIQAMEGGHEYIPVSVPLIPTEKLYAQVIVMPMERDRYTAKVYLQSPLNARQEIMTGDDHLIGMITEGEGRRVMRILVVEDFGALMNSTFLTCRSTLHDYARKAALATFPGKWDARDRLLMAWHMRWYGKCYYCVQDEGTKVRFDDDLIPDVPGTPTERWRRYKERH